MVMADLARVPVALAFLLARDPGTLWIAFVAAALLSFGAAVFEPTSSASLPNLVADEELGEANVLIGSAWGTMLAVGAALGGVVAATLGRDAAFVINAASFGASALLVVGIPGPSAGMARTEPPRAAARRPERRARLAGRGRALRAQQPHAGGAAAVEDHLRRGHRRDRDAGHLRPRRVRRRRRGDWAAVRRAWDGCADRSVPGPIGGGSGGPRTAARHCRLVRGLGGGLPAAAAGTGAVDCVAVRLRRASGRRVAVDAVVLRPAASQPGPDPRPYLQLRLRPGHGDDRDLVPDRRLAGGGAAAGGDHLDHGRAGRHRRAGLAQPGATDHSWAGARAAGG